MNKKGEAIGALIGSLVGCILTGVAVYFTKSPYCAAIGFVCMMLGDWIGKSVGN